MNIFEAIKTRRSVRTYRNQPVEEGKIVQILNAARQAPSAKNFQEWRFIVVRDTATKGLLAEAAKGQPSVREAGVVIACCAQTDNHVMTCGQVCYPIDVAIAIDHMTLAAVELGLGTCWIGAFFEPEVKKILAVPEEIRVVELLTIGYPKDEEGAPQSRLDFDSIVFWDTWQGRRG